MTCSDLLSIAPSARTTRLCILLCVVPRHIDSCRPTPFESVDRSWSFPLLQLLQELLSSSRNPGELVYEELGDTLSLCMLLFFAFLWVRFEPAVTGVGR